MILVQMVSLSVDLGYHFIWEMLQGKKYVYFVYPELMRKYTHSPINLPLGFLNYFRHKVKAMNPEFIPAKSLPIPCSLHQDQ